MRLVGSLSGPVFGTVDQPDIILESIEEKAPTDQVAMEAGQGEVVDLAIIDKPVEFTADFTVKNAAGAPAASLRGHAFSIAGDDHFDGTYIVTEVTRTRTKKNWMTGKLSAVRQESGWTTTTTT